ncbi:hypothetical protein BC831DRAFT_450892 [Entophlyctis helioformis]|nr:hypothetical protein BC831DRAFT_450892 [Entophlyctis helioformis]
MSWSNAAAASASAHAAADAYSEPTDIDALFQAARDIEDDHTAKRQSVGPNGAQGNATAAATGTSAAAGASLYISGGRDTSHESLSGRRSVTGRASVGGSGLRRETSSQGIKNMLLVMTGGLTRSRSRSTSIGKAAGPPSASVLAGPGVVGHAAAAAMADSASGGGGGGGGVVPTEPSSSSPLTSPAAQQQHSKPRASGSVQRSRNGLDSGRGVAGDDAGSVRYLGSRRSQVANTAASGDDGSGHVDVDSVLSLSTSRALPAGSMASLAAMSTSSAQSQPPLPPSSSSPSPKLSKPAAAQKKMPRSTSTPYPRPLAVGTHAGNMSAGPSSPVREMPLSLRVDVTAPSPPTDATLSPLLTSPTSSKSKASGTAGMLPSKLPGFQSVDVLDVQTPMDVDEILSIGRHDALIEAETNTVRVVCHDVDDVLQLIDADGAKTAWPGSRHKLDGGSATGSRDGLSESQRARSRSDPALGPPAQPFRIGNWLLNSSGSATAQQSQQPQQPQPAVDTSKSRRHSLLHVIGIATQSSESRAARRLSSSGAASVTPSDATKPTSRISEERLDDSNHPATATKKRGSGSAGSMLHLSRPSAVGQLSHGSADPLKPPQLPSLPATHAYVDVEPYQPADVTDLLLLGETLHPLELVGFYQTENDQNRVMADVDRVIGLAGGVIKNSMLDLSVDANAGDSVPNAQPASGRRRFSFMRRRSMNISY